MVYNSGSTGIDSVRLNSGNVLDEYPDTEITKKINAAYGKVQLAVKRKKDNPYVSDDVELDYATQIELNLATMYALKAYGPEFIDKIKELRDEVKEDLAILVEGTEFPTDTDLDIEEILERTDFKSWNKNTSLDPPNRMIRVSTGIEANF